LLGDPQFDQAWVTRERLAAVAIIPLLADDELLGIQATFFRRPLGPEIVEVLGTFAGLVAKALREEHTHRPDAERPRQSA
jgi:GAF domain-containing protein